MSVEQPEQPAAPGASTAGERRRISVVGALGELLLMAGALILQFLGWRLWWNDAIMPGQQPTAASDLSTGCLEEARADRTDAPAAEPTDSGEPVVGPESYANGTPFAVMYVPRFGDGSQHSIAEGTGLDVLNSFELAVGHYPGTQMPGQVGNFAIASHRSAYGGGMHEIEQLRLGDAIYIRTRDDWYTYRFRDLEYVTPETVEVLAPVPNIPDLQPTDRLITLTSCYPLYSTAERIIAYGVYDSFHPRSGGVPAEIASNVTGAG